MSETNDNLENIKTMTEVIQRDVMRARAILWAASQLAVENNDETISQVELLDRVATLMETASDTLKTADDLPEQIIDAVYRELDRAWGAR